MLSLKRKLVGTSLGRIALNVRNLLEILHTPRVALGTVVNDQLAGALVARLCREGETFVDIGAHIGSMIAEVKFYCPKARIIAFEAIPEKAENLTRKFPDVLVHSCALSDEEGETSFYVDLEESGCSSLAARPGRSQEIRVNKKLLDTILFDSDVHIIKIDVEGAELGVLRGADKLITRCQPIIMFESGPGDVLGYTKNDIFQWFAKHDYGLFAPNRVAHTGGPMTLDGFLDSHEYPRRTTNYFAIPMGRFQEIRLRAQALGGGQV